MGGEYIARPLALQCCARELMIQGSMRLQLADLKIKTWTPIHPARSGRAQSALLKGERPFPWLHETLVLKLSTCPLQDVLNGGSSASTPCLPVALLCHCLTASYVRVRCVLCYTYRIHTCMYVRTYVCTYVCMHVCMYVWMDVWMYGCIDVWMYVCMHVCMYVYCIYVHTYVGTIYIYIYTYMHIYIHIYTYAYFVCLFIYVHTYLYIDVQTYTQGCWYMHAYHMYICIYLCVCVSMHVMCTCMRSTNKIHAAWALSLSGMFNSDRSGGSPGTGNSLRAALAKPCMPQAARR